MDPATVAWLDQQDAWMRTTVRKYGWVVEYVGGGTCSHPGCEGGSPELPFGYTVGLHGMGHPELLIFGCDQQVTLHVLNSLGSQILLGTDLCDGERCEVEGWPRTLQLLAVPNPEQILLAAYRFYRCDRPGAIEALQLCWSDAAGRFPWESGCAVDARRQPPPGEFAA
jgi:hypothetical protein